MIDWKRKFSSRKFWMAIAGFVSGMMIFFGRSKSEASQVGALIMSAASVIAYVISEGWVDSANAGFYYSEGEESNDDIE